MPTVDKYAIIDCEHRSSHYSDQKTLTYFVRGSITARLTSCLTGLDSTNQANMLLIQHKQSS